MRYLGGNASRRLHALYPCGARTVFLAVRENRRQGLTIPEIILSECQDADRLYRAPLVRLWLQLSVAQLKYNRRFFVVCTEQVNLVWERGIYSYPSLATGIGVYSVVTVLIVPLLFVSYPGRCCCDVECTEKTKVGQSLITMSFCSVFAFFYFF